MRHNQFADRIKELRQSKDVRQSDVARAVFGTTTNERGNIVARNRSQVSRWEKGLALPDEKNIRKLAEFFGVMVSDLLPEAARPVNSGLKIEDMGGGRAHLVVDRVVPMRVAMQIGALLADA